ncbi:MAG: AI-2E family transporter [Anaerolineales bacterium]|nr:MAG: AI-2E family transporter [Anaerolineales bacterium]
MKRQWSTQTRFFILTILIISMVFFIYYARDLIGPLVISALVAYVLHPAVANLENRTPVNHKLAVFLVYVAFIAVLAVIPAVVTPAIINQVDSMDIEVQRIVIGISDYMAQTTIMGYPIFQGIQENLENSVTQILHPGQLFESIQAITENVVWVFVIMITIYYFMLDWENVRRWGYSLIPETYQGDAIRLYRQLAGIWKTYLRGQLLTMFIIGVISGVAATILGLPGAIIIGLVAAAMAVVPSVGSSLMVIVVGVVALFSQSATFSLTKFWFVVIVVGVFAGIHTFDNYWLRPRILGQGLDLHPGIVLVGVIGALTIGGVLLALVIVPLISTVEVFVRYILCRMTGTNPWPEQGEGG